MAALVLLLPAVASGSEQSQRLQAKGDVAYAAGRYDEARQLYEQAVAADPEDAAAEYSLGLALGRLERWNEAIQAFERALAIQPDFPEAQRGLTLARSIAAEDRAVGAAAEFATPTHPESGRAKRWGASFLTGFEYDDNVTLTPDGQAGLGAPDQSDGKFILSGGGHYDVLVTEKHLLRAEYDLYQTLNIEITDFNFRAHQMRGTASRRFLPYLWAGVQGGYNHYTLGDDGYLSEPFVKPFVSVLAGDWGLTQIVYRHGDATYLSDPFENVRDGPVQTVGAAQTSYFGGGKYYATAGFDYSTERPDGSAGPVNRSSGSTTALPSDYRFASYQGHVGLGAALWWQTVVDFAYVYRYDDYTRPNSFAGFQRTRQDNFQQFFVRVGRPITERFRAGIEYYATLNDSNVSEFEYTRNQVSMLVEFFY